MTSKSEVGDLNRNKQQLVRKTEEKGTDHNQYVWEVECRSAPGGDICGTKYRINGSDFHERKCPICQGGKPGI